MRCTRTTRKKAKSVLMKLQKQLRQHEEDLIRANVSPNGWLAMAKLRGKTELPETIR
jgi:hypothetical protein